MRDGFYRLVYMTDARSSTGVITLHDGIIAGCDPYYFLHGTYKKSGNDLSGEIVFERHSPREGDEKYHFPKVFQIQFSGSGSSIHGQFAFHCPDTPAITGEARFSWLGTYQQSA